jgi:HD-like signal output (HDOD) protein
MPTRQAAAHDAPVDHDPLRERVREPLARLRRTGALPALPQAALAALAIARDPDADADRLCRVIETDVGLAARVVRVANSAAYVRRKVATTLQAAVLTIGLRKTCDILVAAGARRLYGVASRQAESLWSHALASALACEELARLTRVVEPGVAFLPGLFHDVGRIALFVADPAAFRTIDDADPHRPVRETERFGLDHAQVGGVLTEDWGVAAEQADAIRWHHEPAQARLGRELATLIHAADALVYGADRGLGPTRPRDGMALAPFGLSPEDEADCAERVRAAFAEHRALLA